MTEKSLIIQLYGDSTRMRIVDFLMEFTINEFITNELVENIGMSKTTLCKQLTHMNDLDMVKLRKEGKESIFSINMDNPTIQTIKAGISMASDKIVQTQNDAGHFATTLKKISKRSLVERKALLKTELVFTNKALKSM